MKKKILLRGYYGRGNFGDDALLLSATKLVNDVFGKNEAEIFLEPRCLANYLPGVIGHEFKTYNPRESVDFVVYGGGTQFFSFKKISRRDKVRFWTSELKRKPISTIEEIVRRVHKRVRSSRKNYQIKKTEKPIVAMAGVGFGRQKDSRSETKALDVVKAASVIMVRDQYSLEYLRSVTPNKKVFRTADLCYFYFRDICNRIAKERFRDRACNSREKRQLGIILRDWKWLREDFNEKVVDSVLDCIDESWAVKVFILSSDEDQSVKNICDERGLESEAWFSGDNKSFESYIKKLSSCDGIISSRYHGLVFAALLGIPHLSLSIDRKLSAHQSENQELCIQWRPNDGYIKLKDCIDTILKRSTEDGMGTESLKTLYNASQNNVDILRNELSDNDYC